MELKSIAQRLGVETYPASFDEIYVNLEQDKRPACDLALIESAEQEFRAFGEYYSQVREAAEQINNDDVYSSWVKVVVEYLSQGKDMRQIPIPPPQRQFETGYADAISLGFADSHRRSSVQSLGLHPRPGRGIYANLRKLHWKRM